jgi:hypothetical protein
LFLSVLSCIHFSVSLEAVSVSLVYLIHTLHTTSYRSISLVSILSSRAFFDCFVRPVSFFCKSHIPPSSHFFLVSPIIFSNGDQLDFLGGTPMPPS